MGDKLAVIILDALDDYNTKQLEMSYLDSLIRTENSEVLGISSLPYTAQSNPLIWAGFENKDMFWVKPGTEKWSFPAGAFDRDEEKAVEKAEGVWTRGDFQTTFVWDELHHQGVDSSALHIPFVLPPYSFNTLEDEDLGENWFPHSSDQISGHADEMPSLVKRHVDAGREFIAVSIQIPDKPLHALSEDDGLDAQEARSICSDFDEEMKGLIEYLESNGFDWVILGDHGSPWPGNIKVPETKQFVPNHRKNSVIVSNMECQLPTYTDELHGFILDYFGADSVDFKDLGMSYINFMAQ